MHFLQAPEAIDVGPVLNHADTLLEARSWQNIWRSCWLTQTTAPTPPSELAGDRFEVHLFEGLCPLGMKETAMGAYTSGMRCSRRSRLR